MTGCLNGGSCLFDKKQEKFCCSCKFPWSGGQCEIKAGMHGLFYSHSNAI